MDEGKKVVRHDQPIAIGQIALCPRCKQPLTAGHCPAEPPIKRDSVQSTVRHG